MLQTSYERGTKDSDVLETPPLLDPTVRGHLVALAGAGSDLHRRHRLYLELVSAGLPFLPQTPHWHDLAELNNDLAHFEIAALEVVDVVVSKLKRFSPADEEDVDAMVTQGHVPHEALVERFRSAVDAYLMDARAADLPRYVANLNQVERDLLGAPTTEIELPPWLDR
jgi:hypothetical protein